MNRQLTSLGCTAVLLCASRMAAQNAGERITYNNTVMYESLAGRMSGGRCSKPCRLRRPEVPPKAEK